MATIEVKLRASAGKQTIDEAAIQEVTHGRGVKDDFMRRARNVMDYQQANVGVKTGRLRSTIRIEQDDDATTSVIAGRAGETPYLGYQMYGAAPHVIRPRSSNGMLRFYWEKVGAQVAFRRVSHPGSKATRFVQESVKMWVP